MWTMPQKDNDLILTIYLDVRFGKDFVVFLKPCLCLWKTKFQGSLLLQSSNLETINRNAELSCPEGEGRRGCFLGTKYRFTELLSRSDVVQEQITGKENEGREKPSKRLMFSIMHNSAHDKELRSQSKSAWWLIGAHASLTAQRMERVSEASFLWGSWDPEGALWVADRDVGKALQFSLRLMGQLLSLLSPSFLFLSSSFLPLLSVNLWFRHYSRGLPGLSFLLGCSVFSWGFHRVTGSRHRGVAFSKSSCVKSVRLVNSNVKEAEGNSKRIYWVSSAKSNMRRNLAL